MYQTYLAERRSSNVAGVTTKLLTARHCCFTFDADVLLQWYSLVKLIWFLSFHRIVMNLCLLNKFRLYCRQYCLLLLFLAVFVRFLRTALAFTNDISKRCSRIFCLSLSICRHVSVVLVFVDGLCLENTLSGIHGIDLFIFNSLNSMKKGGPAISVDI